MCVYFDIFPQNTRHEFICSWSTNIGPSQGIYKGVGSLKHRACPFAVTVQWNLIQEMPLIF